MTVPAAQRLPTEERQALIVAAAIELAGQTSPAAITTADI
ncbi:MAG: TetR/AcrR family transcriptional regulator, partial [Burkholderiaceae bacterium]|nr:TetR/AcrR family transcriptional regulator [Burkholderiaceae bacterium]